MRKLSLEEFVTLSHKLAFGYFTEEGSYSPSLGRINTLVLFYEHMVDGDSKPDEPLCTVQEIADYVTTDYNLSKKFKAALNDEGYLSFASALSDAMLMVDNWKKILGNNSSMKYLLNSMEKHDLGDLGKHKKELQRLIDTANLVKEFWKIKDKEEQEDAESL